MQHTQVRRIMYPDIFHPTGGIPQHLNFEEIRQLIDACLDVPNWKRRNLAERNELFLETLWQAGCRVGEITGGHQKRKGEIIGRYPGLRPCDIDIRRASLNIQIEKRQRAIWHWVKVEPQLITQLVAYHLENDIPRETRIFAFGKRMAETIVKAAVIQAGLPSWIHAHTLRHSHAMHLREQGVHPFIMQEALGHATIGSTLVYSRVSDEDSARAKAQIRWS